jgi:hypothetical protein
MKIKTELPLAPTLLPKKKRQQISSPPTSRGQSPDDAHIRKGVEGVYKIMSLAVCH